MMLLTRLGCRWAALLAGAGLLAACQSSRPTFQLAPAAPYLGTTRPPVALVLPPAAAPRTVPAVPTARLPVFAGPPRPAARVRGTRPQPACVDQPAALAAAVAPAVTGLAARLAPRRLHRPRLATARIQENGLGNIALFFIVVVLGVLAGLGALVALIPGVSFWGGVGLAAAGLLVLYLLYSLLSGSKRKKV